jgi:ABC-type multidrug transport system fused ATPase/permease subunit
MIIFSHADSIYQGIADHLPMTIFIIANLIATLAVCFYIQWSTTLVMLTAIPVLFIVRIIFTKVTFLQSMPNRTACSGSAERWKTNRCCKESWQTWCRRHSTVSARLFRSAGRNKQFGSECRGRQIARRRKNAVESRFEKLVKDSGRLTSQRLKASSIYDALAQVLVTEMIFTAAMCFGIIRLAGDEPGELAAVGDRLHCTSQCTVCSCR